MIGLVISLLISFATGFLLIAGLWGCKRTLHCHLAIKLCLAFGVGFGLSSVVFFLLALSLGTVSQLAAILADVLILTGAYGFYWRRGQGNNSVLALCAALPMQRGAFFAHSVNKVVLAGVVLIGSLALLVVVKQAVANPHGEWDAWAIWNTHARFLFRGGTQWANVFSPELLGTHADYPWLLPSLVARSWTYAGSDTVLAPMSIALLFTLATAALLFAGLSALKGTRQGLIAASVLLGTPFFLLNGASQYADVPLSFYFLTTVVLWLLFLHNTKHKSLLFLTGMTAGMALFTKNEGILFFAVCTIGFFALLAYTRGKLYVWRDYRWFLLGALPVMLLMLFVKIHYAPANDLFNAKANQSILMRVLNVERYKTVAVAFVRGSTVFGDFLGMPTILFLVEYLLVTGIIIDKKGKLPIFYIAIILVLMLAGYLLVYIVSPRDLVWHLQSSLTRLFMQLWPSILYLVFLLDSSSDTNTRG